jgi:hypothetical protein
LLYSILKKSGEMQTDGFQQQKDKGDSRPQGKAQQKEYQEESGPHSK